MPDRWISHPDRPPHRCPFTQQSAPADGPYFEARLLYFEAVDDQAGNIFPGRHPQQLYLSPQAIREACEVPGSPYVAVPREQYQGDQAELDRLRAELDAAETRVDELESENSLLNERLGNPIDAKALGEFIEVLDARYAKKPGPKPKTHA